MATDQLKLYNGALLNAKTRKLASLTEAVDSRRWLDEVWNDGAIKSCLEAGQWNFATRTGQFDYDTSVTPTFGYKRAFAKPSDWVITTAVCTDEFFGHPQLHYTDEADYWYAEDAQLYIKYVSDDANYGMNYSIWPGHFIGYVKAYLAYRIAPSLRLDAEEIVRIEKLMDMALMKAKNNNQMALPTKFPAQGAWVRSRGGRRSNSGERGSSGSFTG